MSRESQVDRRFQLNRGSHPNRRSQTIIAVQVWPLAVNQAEAPPRQCAWCRRLFDETGPLSDPLPELRRDATHGLCDDCYDAMMQRDQDRRRPATLAAV